MNLFELLFIVLFLASVVTLARVGVLAVSKRRAAAAQALRRFAIAVAIYLTVVLVSSGLVARDTLALGEPLCFDDWCITIQNVTQQQAQEYVVTAMLSSRARRVPQRETGVVLYLCDAEGTRYAAAPAREDAPFDVQLEPGATVQVTRTFQLPRGKVPVGVVIAHEGGFPIDWFIINAGPFKEPPMVLLSHR